MDQMITSEMIDQLQQAMILNFDIIDGIISGKYELKKNLD